MTIQRGDCGHLKSHWDNHKKCINCSQCFRESTCSTCSSWSNSVWDLAENRRSYLSKEKDMSTRKNQSVSSDERKKKHGSTAPHGVTGRVKTHIGGNSLGTKGSTSPLATGNRATVTGHPTTDPLGNGQSPNGQEDTFSRPGIPGHQPPGIPGNQASGISGHQALATRYSPTIRQMGKEETSSLPTRHRLSRHQSLESDRQIQWIFKNHQAPGTPGHRPTVTGHQNIASDSQTFDAEFTSKQPGTSRVLLPLEPDFSNMSDPSVVIEPPSNSWRSDNNNDNYRQNRTSLSGRRSRRDQSRKKHRYKKRRRRSASTSSSSTYSSSDSRKRKSRRSKLSRKKRKRRYTSPSFTSSVSHSQVRDYGRY